MMDTAILGIASVFLIIILWNWHIDPNTRFSLTELLTDSKTGRVSLMKTGQFMALMVSTWVLIRETHENRLTEWLFLAYLGVWSGANLVNKAITMKKEQSNGQNE